MEDPRKNRGRGALLGALVGDAAGGVLEFMPHAPTPEEIDEALRFPGGDVQAWLGQALAGKTARFTPQDGFVKIAFTHAFHHLHVGTNYSDSIRETLAGGGDTDTNASIVGGLIGALHGADAIPQAWRDAVHGCETELGQLRPPWLFASTADELIEALLARAGA